MAATRNKSKDNQQSAANTVNSVPPADEKRAKGKSEANATTSEDQKNAMTGQPLGPPPKPNQANGNDGPGYFDSVHSNGPNANGAYGAEPNPFEEQFGGKSADTPGKIGLPPLASLTSPSSLLPNDTPGWASLRSGPLSPAMLAGPATSDYFDPGYNRGFPTPNESSLRTGLTPGGTGSMFPAPSPGSALFNTNLGLSTPSGLDFMRAAKSSTNGLGPTSQPMETPTSQGMDLKMPVPQANAFDPGHADTDAANGLFLLAQSNGARQSNGFPPQQASQASSSAANQAPPAPSQGRNGTKASIGSNSTNMDMDDLSDSDQSEEMTTKPITTRSRGKKSASETKSTPNNRRKATDSAGKGPAAKRARNSIAQDKMESSPIDDEEMTHKDGKKMNDEEKRKNFLERNRVAALKCRQRKKQWLANLQNKCDLYTQENDALTHTVNQLKDQLVSMRNLLIQHKDCPVTLQHANLGAAFNQIMNQDPMMQYAQTNNGAVQPMTMMFPDGRQQLPTSQGHVLPRS
ncbi:hypothetical protein BT63DRAFT_418807 [Microthyrium microscopicum]|uniref:BZIP domain-containing protein n=1 Tax=Microthyrium microscopicum TaxID=703497 RepID=A0A6A6TY53_9PEZI|nr:hypothetical protein BT63DRAFT_418807 [Microthyrium microscopicum]